MLRGIGDGVIGATKLYGMLGWTVSLGNRVKAELQENDLIVIESIVSRKGGRPSLKITVNSQGRRFLEEYGH